MKLKAITRYHQEGNNYHVYFELFVPNKGGVIYMSVPVINKMLAYFEITKSEFAELDEVEGVILTAIPANPKKLYLNSADLLHDFEMAYSSFLRMYNTKNKPFPFIMQKPNIVIDSK